LRHAIKLVIGLLTTCLLAACVTPASMPGISLTERPDSGTESAEQGRLVVGIVDMRTSRSYAIQDAPPFDDGDMLRLMLRNPALSYESDSYVKNSDILPPDVTQAIFPFSGLTPGKGYELSVRMKEGGAVTRSGRADGIEILPGKTTSATIILNDEGLIKIVGSFDGNPTDLDDGRWPVYEGDHVGFETGFPLLPDEIKDLVQGIRAVVGPEIFPDGTPLASRSEVLTEADFADREEFLGYLMYYFWNTGDAAKWTFRSGRGGPVDTTLTLQLLDVDGKVIGESTILIQFREAVV